MTFRIAKWLFLLLVVSVPLVRPFNFRISEFVVPYTDIIFLSCFVFWLIAVLRGDALIRRDKLYFFLGFYALALAVSAVFSVEPARSFLKLAGELYLLSLAFLTFNLAEDRIFVKKIVAAWLVGTGVTALASIVGFALFYTGLETPVNNYFLSPPGSLPSGNYPRIHALFYNANMMANYLNVSIMLALAAGRLGWLKRTAAKLLQIATAFAVFFTLSPGIGGILLSVGVWYSSLARLRKSHRLAIAFLGAGIAVGAIFLAASLVSPNTTNTDLEFSVPGTEITLEASSRLLLWREAMSTFVQYPITGKGVGTDVADLAYTTLSGQQQRLGDAHNIWLSVAAQSGLFGLAAFVLLTAWILRSTRLSFTDESEKDVLLTALSCAFLGAFIYQGLTGSFEDARHLWILIGLIAAVARFDDETEPLPAGHGI